MDWSVWWENLATCTEVSLDFDFPLRQNDSNSSVTVLLQDEDMLKLDSYTCSKWKKYIRVSGA